MKIIMQQLLRVVDKANGVVFPASLKVDCVMKMHNSLPFHFLCFVLESIELIILVE